MEGIATCALIDDMLTIAPSMPRSTMVFAAQIVARIVSTQALVNTGRDTEEALYTFELPAAAARGAVAAALAAGIETVSVDLIFGLPRQTSDDWRGQLETAAELGSHHLSCYQLTVEPGTPFAVMRRRGRLRELLDRKLPAVRPLEIAIQAVVTALLVACLFAVTDRLGSRRDRRYLG